mmetsp:Transcript_34509/g.77815  ORF Transcript_34509/g.77815 Transcript_34509/m.77815 type:complete len:276 (-) Transcript_34509:1819-2646(-)
MSTNSLASSRNSSLPLLPSSSDMTVFIAEFSATCARALLMILFDMTYPLQSSSRSKLLVLAASRISLMILSLPKSFTFLPSSLSDNIFLLISEMRRKEARERPSVLFRSEPSFEDSSAKIKMQSKSVSRQYSPVSNPNSSRAKTLCRSRRTVGFPWAFLIISRFSFSFSLLPLSVSISFRSTTGTVLSSQSSLPGSTVPSRCLIMSAMSLLHPQNKILSACFLAFLPRLPEKESRARDRVCVARYLSLDRVPCTGRSFVLSSSNLARISDRLCMK